MKLPCFVANSDINRLTHFFVLMFWSEKCACAIFHAFCMSESACHPHHLCSVFQSKCHLRYTFDLLFTYLLGNRRNAGDQSVLIGPRGGWRLFISLNRRKNNHDYDDDADKITESVCHLAVIFEEGAMHRR